MKKLLIIFIAFIYSSAYAQSINGTVYRLDENGKKEPLPFATVFWSNTNNVVNTDDNGHFSTKRKDDKHILLIASYIGCVSDTVNIKQIQISDNIEFVLRNNNFLGSVIVRGKSQGSFLQKTAPVKTEVITAAGLCKMACCNLAESFENSASVSVGYSDAITGARQIKLLGLSGVYTQMMDEQRPALRGVSGPFGLSYIPGQWLESIQIAKGPSSVMNGYEAISGQINVEHRKPNSEQLIFGNLFLSNKLRKEMNLTTSLKLSDKISTSILTHYSDDKKGHDGNNDGFLDEPKTDQVLISNRWLYLSDNGMQVRFGYKLLNDNRISGQHHFNPKEQRDTTTWGSKINNSGGNVYLKVGVPLKKQSSTDTLKTIPNLAFVADYSYFRQHSFFGLKNYDGTQNSIYTNLMLQGFLKSSSKYIIGLNLLYDNYNEKLEDFWINYVNNNQNQNRLVIDLSRKETVFGGYGEYTYSKNDKITFVAGVRLDYNSLHKLIFTPRSSIKLNITDNLILRANAGKGTRTSNAIADNIGVLSTGRKVEIDNKILTGFKEEAFTYGVSLTYHFKKILGENSTLSIDWFKTKFYKQVLVDMEKDINNVSIITSTGRSFNNTYQVDLNMYPFERFSTLLTVRYTDSKVSLPTKGFVEPVLVSKYKAVLNLQYATRMNKWTFDFTAQLNGKSRLPDYSGGGYSKPYPVFFAQITRKHKNFELYAGGENIGNYVQKYPILSYNKPYSKEFNSTVIWGPIMGRKFYLGLRYTLWHK